MKTTSQLIAKNLVETSIRPASEAVAVFVEACLSEHGTIEMLADGERIVDTVDADNYTADRAAVQLVSVYLSEAMTEDARMMFIVDAVRTYGNHLAGRLMDATEK